MLPKTGGRLNYLQALWGLWKTPRYNPFHLVGENKGVIGFNLSFLFDRQDLLGCRRLCERRVQWDDDQDVPSAALHRQCQERHRNGGRLRWRVMPRLHHGSDLQYERRLYEQGLLRRDLQGAHLHRRREERHRNRRGLRRWRLRQVRSGQRVFRKR